MADLDILRPEVREAINRQDRQEKCDEYCPVCEDRATIRAELLAPTAAARIVNDGRGGITRTYVCHESQSCIVLPSLDGKRVRLVVEE